MSRLAGGEDETTIFGELYAFDFTTHTFVQQVFATNMSRPLERKEHIAFSRNITSGIGAGSTAMYIFGGQSQVDYTNGMYWRAFVVGRLIRSKVHDTSL